MEDSAAILCQISSYKDMLDQVNEEIEAKIEKTREIESEMAKCSEMEKECLMKESQLTNMIVLGELELKGLAQFTLSSRKLVESIQTEMEILKKKSTNLEKEISLKREGFINECNNFQADILTGENEEINALISERKNLESEILNLNMKINALRTSTAEFIEDVLGELHRSNLGMKGQKFRPSNTQFPWNHAASPPSSCWRPTLKETTSSRRPLPCVGKLLMSLSVAWVR